MSNILLRVLPLLMSLCAYAAEPYAAEPLPTILLPPSGLMANELGLIVNEQDPLSVKIAEYYQKKRAIPDGNVIRISFEPGQTVMHPGVFAVLQKSVEAKTPVHIQAYALTWAAPYRVGCMSISSAFALGYDIKYCATGCKPTTATLYSNSDSLRPYRDFSIRPTMLLAAEDLSQAKKLIDRGVAADGLAVTSTGLRGSAYLLETTDKSRNVRKAFFPAIRQKFADRLPIKILQADSVKARPDIMFYFAGTRFVEDIDSNVYLPGAMADHLTSTGGKLTDSSQMSALRWLEAGATGSYGTVVEPCNLLAKFPNPGIALTKYSQGESLLEAYWKSVKTPGQGVFIGEPLAKPYAGYRLRQTEGILQLSSPVFTPGYYAVWVASRREGPFSLLRSGVPITAFQTAIELSSPYSAFYKIERLNAFGQLPIPSLLR